MLQPNAIKPYEALGGSEGVRRLVNVFYDLVENDPAAEPLMKQHRANSGLAHAREEQFMFMSGFLGGPQLYMEHHHHANVRQMHAHLKITAVERAAWLDCMDKALIRVGADPKLHAYLMTAFTRVAMNLQNA